MFKVNNFYLKAEHTSATLKQNTHALFSSRMLHAEIVILASEVDLICLARNSHLKGFSHALPKMV